MKKRFFEQPKETFLLNGDVCILGERDLFCSCGYREKLIMHKGRDYCPECGLKATDIEEFLILGTLHIKDKKYFEQNFYKLIIEYDHEIGTDVFIQYIYQLSFDSASYKFFMKQFDNEKLILVQEKVFFSNKYDNFKKLTTVFDSGLASLNIYEEQNDELDDEPTDEFIFMLGTEFPQFAHSWLFNIFYKYIVSF